MTRQLTKTELQQLLAYCNHIDWHYGNKKQFDKRYESILDWIENQLIDYVIDEGIEKVRGRI